jgi:hypothetical protein
LAAVIARPTNASRQFFSIFAVDKLKRILIFPAFALVCSEPKFTDDGISSLNCSSWAGCAGV